MDRGVVCYSNSSKETMLGVPARLLEDHGAVSEPVACAMAEGMCQRHRMDVALAITGIAGPDGGTPAKPVGTVWIAVAGPAGTRSRLAQFTGDRLTIKAMATSAAIDYLRRYVQAASASG
jgi:PncC family amidohydrolase